MKTLLAPLNTVISGKVIHEDKVLEEDNTDELLPEVNYDNDDDENNKDKDDVDDGIDELQELSENEWVQVMENMTAVHEMVTKVCVNEAEDVCLLVDH